MGIFILLGVDFGLHMCTFRVNFGAWKQVYVEMSFQYVF